MLTFNVTSPGIAAKIRKLRGPQRRRINFAAASELRDLVRKTIKDGKAPDGQKWKPLKAGGRFVGRGKNRRLDTSALPLRDTGKLQRSQEISANSRRGVVRFTSGYAKYHQFGTRGGIPARPFAPRQGRLPRAWRDDIARAIRFELRIMLK